MLSVCFKGTPTHHLVERVDKEHPYKIGKTELPGNIKSLAGVVSHLRKVHSYWPVALKIAVAQQEGADKATPDKNKEEQVNENDSGNSETKHEAQTNQNDHTEDNIEETAAPESMPSDPEKETEPKSSDAPVNSEVVTIDTEIVNPNRPAFAREYNLGDLIDVAITRWFNDNGCKNLHKSQSYAQRA